MKTLFAVTATLLVLGHSLAFAQNSQRNPPNAQPTNGAVPEAPIGHRQPRPANLPPETGKNNPDRIDAQDRALDRMIKNICKGC